MVIHCTNPACRVLVAQPVGRCPTCQTPLPYRLLLAVGQGGVQDVDLALPSGTRIARRYLVWKHPVWLDTQPEHPIAPVDTIPPEVLPYLRLSGLIQHIPRPYDYLDKATSGLGNNVLLLEAAPLAVTLPASASEAIQVQVLPLLAQAWAGGTALQQLNWLRQIAFLWPALAKEQVAATLLTPEILRVDHALLRVTRLVADDPHQPPALASLGHRWRPWVAQAQPSLQDYLGWLTEALAQGAFPSAAALEEELEQAIQTLAAGFTVTVEWDADTDQGPARDRNEDACFPQRQAHKQVISGQKPTEKPLPLLLVCDGIGGHEHGNVASQIAIQTLVEMLQPLAQGEMLGPSQVAQVLTQAMTQVNTNIAQRNNDEQRSARARMGTTAVLALVHSPYVSIVHLGDSRAYRVSAQTAYPMTLDDDVASREVRFGYALYQEAIHMPGGGALVQALGINDSEYLYPTVQHFLMDDPCVLLLCSDGLCDYDRVEQLWPHTLAPLAKTQMPLTEAIQDLIQWANRLNGHDNVTVGLMRFSPQALQGKRLPAAALALPNAAAPANIAQTIVALPSSPNGEEAGLVAQPTAKHPRRGRWWALLAGALPTLVLLLGASWAYRHWYLQPVALRSLPPLPQGLAGEAWAGLVPPVADLPLGSFWQRSTDWTNPDQPDPLALVSAPQGMSSNSLPTLPAGSILKVVDRRRLPDQTQWVYLQVCATPTGQSVGSAPPAPTSAVADGEVVDGEPMVAPNPIARVLAQPGRQGWVNARSLTAHATPLAVILPSQRGVCP